MYILVYMILCKKCNKEFKTKFLLDRHIKRKIPCVSDKNLILKYDEQIQELNNKSINLLSASLVSMTQCKFCEKYFSRKGNLQRHINSSCINKKEIENKLEELCYDKINIEKKYNKENINKLYNEINIQKNEIDLLKKTLETLINKQCNNNVTIQQIINNNNVTNNNNLFVNLNSFGKENISHITEKDYNKYLTGFFPGFIKFIEKIHFDDKMPENHNIFVTNLKSKYMYIYDEDKWISKEKDDIIDNIIRKNYNLLDGKCEEYENKEINENIINKFRQFQKNYIDEESQKNTKKDVLLLLYNNRDKVEKVKKNHNLIE